MQKEIKTIDKVISHFGSAYKAAQALGIKHQQFYSWQKNGYIPFKRGNDIESITGGAVKAIEVWEAAGKHS